jgi:acetyl esterase/lipase
MRLRRMGFGAFALLPLLALSSAAQQTPSERPFQEARDAPPVSSVPAAAPSLVIPMVRGAEPVNSYGPQKVQFSDGVSAVFDLTYTTVPGYRPLTLDLYSPRPQPGPLPLVVFVHGGGWNGGDARHAGTFEDFPAQLAALAAQGYVVASVNYRLSEEAHFPAALQDVKEAIRWLRAGAASRNIDITRVAVWGAAAGGQLAALTGVTCGVGRFEPQNDAGDKNLPSDCVQAVVDWYGVSDLESLEDDSGKPDSSRASFTAQSTTAEGDYLGCEPADCAPGLARLASPLAFISNMSPAFLIQHGAADTTVPPKQSQRLFDALKAKNVPVELVLYPDVAHDFTQGGNPAPAINAQAMQKLAMFLTRNFPRTTLAGNSPPQIRRDLFN